MSNDRFDPGLLAGYAVAASLAIVAAGIILAAGWRAIMWVLG